MSVFRRRRVVVIAVVTISLGLAAGSIAYASIPDANGVIHGCYNPNGAKATNGTGLNIIDSTAASCGKSMQPISWNQVGSPGAKGATGPTGPAGPSGATGPSDAYTNYGSWGLIQSGDTVTVASVTLPTGSYTLSGAVGAYGGDATLVECKYVSAGTVNGLTAIAATQPSDIDNASEQQMPVLGDVTITSDNTAVFLRCRSDISDANVRGSMIATQVGTITPSE